MQRLEIENIGIMKVAIQEDPIIFFRIYAQLLKSSCIVGMELIFLCPILILQAADTSFPQLWQFFQIPQLLINNCYYINISVCKNNSDGLNECGFQGVNFGEQLLLISQNKIGKKHTYINTLKQLILKQKSCNNKPVWASI